MSYVIGDDAIKQIKEHSDALSGLLADPHPGLYTWAMMFGRQMEWLSNYWDRGVDYANEQLSKENRL